MATVWVAKDGEEGVVAQARSGDYVLAPAGDLVRLGKVDDTRSVHWFATVDASLLPEGSLQGRGEDPLSPPDDQARLLLAVRGVETAQDERGG